MGENLKTVLFQMQIVSENT